MLFVICSLFAECCLLNECCSLRDVCCLMCADRCLMCVVCWLLFVARCLLPVVCRVLPAVVWCCLLLHVVVCGCPLFVVRGVLFVVWCFRCWLFAAC